jgi:hypothetical protein
MNRMQTLELGDGTPRTLACRWLGCFPITREAIVRVRLVQPDGVARVVSHRQSVTVCRRRACALLQTAITVNADEGTQVAGIDVEVEA